MDKIADRIISSVFTIKLHEAVITITVEIAICERRDSARQLSRDDAFVLVTAVDIFIGGDGFGRERLGR